MLPTFVIGLREGLEAALIVGIIAAFLGQQGRRDALRQVWIGTAIAVAICVGIAVLLQVISSDLPQRQQEGLETVVGALAVCMVTYMIMFMRRHARDLKGDLQGSAASALASGSGRALVGMAFLAVLREGFETAVFLLATFHASGDATASWIGAVLGILLAVVIGYGIYRGGIRLNLARFFRVTGLVLVVVAAGLVMTAFHTANEAGWLSVGQQQAFDLSWLVRPGTPLSSLLTGVLGIQPYPVWIEAIAWVAYLVPMILIVAWPARRTAKPAAAVVPAAGASRPRASNGKPLRLSTDAEPDSDGASAGRLACADVLGRVKVRRPMMASRFGRRRGLPLVAAAAAAAALLAGCSSSGSSSGSGSAAAADQTSTTVSIELTSQGCAPKPAKVNAGSVQFNVNNKGAGSVSEAELRTSDLSKILGEQENLTPGLSGGFALTVQPGTYKISCPGAAQQDWTFTVTGKATGQSWQSVPQLAAAVSGYTSYVNQNTADLVSHSQGFCKAVDSGNMAQARVLYPQARVYYERIEPVAEIWGTLDTSIDGRWENPVTVASQFTGFHKLEQLMWEDNTLAGAPALCAGLVKNEQQLLTLVRSAQYNPLEMASGSTDLLNEAAANKISGEEERYSNTDLPVFKANVDGAMEVVGLLTPYLQGKDPSLLSEIKQRDAAVTKVLATLKASPGYDDTGYVEYSTVLDDQRKQLSTVVNALSEEISKLSLQVS